MRIACREAREALQDRAVRQRLRFASNATGHAAGHTTDHASAGNSARRTIELYLGHGEGHAAHS